jgi:C4-dicarboxylate-specific signal transduction histidine kinase
MNRREMKIALTNIVINAIDAMDKKEGVLTIGTNAFENSYMIKIEDNGCGIKEDHLSNIFQPYFTRKPGGLGVGLAQTQDILRSNKVHVHVESQEGRGTSFMLFFEKPTNGSIHKKNNVLKQAVT